MVEGRNTGAADQIQPNITAQLIGNDSVLTVVGVAPGPTGPWPYITGIPNSNSDVPGPPPQYLSVAAWAA